MWTYTANRYKDDPVVVGYDLMVEPNSDNVIGGIDEPDNIYPSHANELEDWSQIFAQINTAIRSVDNNTPILADGIGYSTVERLPYVVTDSDSRTVHAIGQYAPCVYSHQDAGGTNSYPGTFDTDGDGLDDRFNRAWLENLLAAADALSLNIAVNEFGVIRWVPNAADFMPDAFSLFEERNWNQALWQWYPDSYPQMRPISANSTLCLAPQPPTIPM